MTHGAGPDAERRARVLVVDDDELTLRACVRVFEGEHHVIALRRAREAIEQIAAGAEYDLILCDVSMPDLDGISFHAAVWGIVPNMVGRMVFMTGGAIDARTAAFLDTVPNERLEKPFGAERLRALARKYAALAGR
jgi:CheY-like chemotaxis protein